METENGFLSLKVKKKYFLGFLAFGVFLFWFGLDFFRFTDVKLKLPSVETL